MVLSHPFHCPTRVVEGDAFDDALADLLQHRTWALVTSPGWVARGAVDRLSGRCGNPAAVFFDVNTNPTISDVVRLAGRLPAIEAIVALGGGSVIDAAKGAVALRALGGVAAPFLAHLRQGTPLPAGLAPTPILAVPTTAGTGSEVTRWGTIWGDDGIKYSVNHPALYPTHAVLDPALTLLMPGELTLATGLDALSHAMEAVWNRRHSAITDTIASRAITLVHQNLADALARPADLGARRRMQTASLLAGLAMGTTQTALAHSISYPFTARFGMPHGLACSFTLAEVARYNLQTAPDRLTPIAAGLGCAAKDIPATLESWFARLGLGAAVGRYVGPEVADGFGPDLITRSRVGNNIRDVDGAAALALTRAALERWCTAPAVAGRYDVLKAKGQ